MLSFRGPLAQAGALENLNANLAAANAGERLSGLQRLHFPGLYLRLHYGEPEAQLVGEIVASPSGATALDEGRGAEVLQTGAR